MKDPKDLRIVFFGTPDFAVASLRALLDAGMNVVAAVTAPDKPAGRGQTLQESAVKRFAVERGLQVLQPLKLKAPEFVEELCALQADLHIVVAFRMLPEVVWNMPPLGTVNVHGSLLPQYRGAAPINWAIINGETETGVTTFQLQHEIDTGGILLQDKLVIGTDDTVGEVYSRLMEAGASLLVRTVEGLASGTLQPQPQESFAAGELRHAPKIFKEDCKLDWSHSAESVRNRIRGLSPYPAAFTEIDGKGLRIFQSRVEAVETGVAPGSYQTDGKSFLRFAAANGWVYAEDVQLDGKKRMPVADFLRGFRPATT
jgi:methionyl-tRNA formyltransferase